MLASLLSSAGLRTGLYTSPHLLDFRERLRILPAAGIPAETRATLGTLSPELVSEAYVYEFITRWRETFEKLDLSFFEITTGMAFRWFADKKVDVAVIEVGLGGRLDSTNIIRPDLSVITSIGLDHCQLLGHTRAAVAGEKAGIIKPGIPALCGEDDAETAAVFEAKAAAEQAPLAFAPREEPALWNQRRELLAEMDLRGDYQSDNLRTVLAARDILRRDPFYSGLADAATTEDALKVGVESGRDLRHRPQRTGPEAQFCPVGRTAPQRDIRPFADRICGDGRQGPGSHLPVFPAGGFLVFCHPDNATRPARPTDSGSISRVLCGRRNRCWRGLCGGFRRRSGPESPGRYRPRDPSLYRWLHFCSSRCIAPFWAY